MIQHKYQRISHNIKRIDHDKTVLYSYISIVQSTYSIILNLIKFTLICDQLL